MKEAWGSLILVLLALPCHDAYDPHKQIKGMLRDMISSRQSQIAQSTTHDQFCEKELSKSAKRVDELEMQLQKERVHLDKQSAQLDELKDNIGDAYADMADMYKANAKAVSAGPKKDDFKSKFKFNRQQDEFQDAKDRKQKQTTKAERDVIFRKGDITQQEGDIRAIEKQLDAAKEYAEKLRSSCALAGNPAEDRQRRREDQIDGLKDAYSALNGGLR